MRISGLICVSYSSRTGLDMSHILFMVVILLLFFFFKQKTAYEMRISDWSSDVCSSDLQAFPRALRDLRPGREPGWGGKPDRASRHHDPCQIGRASCRERVCQSV